MDLGNQFATSFGMISGNLPKAKLFIRKKASSSDNLSGGGIALNNNVAALRTLVLKQKKKSSAQSAAKKGIVSASELGVIKSQQKMTEEGLKSELSTKGFVSMEVQYNPSSIKMNTVAGHIESYAGIGDKGNNQLTCYEKNVSTYFTVTLVFEDIEEADAFGMEDNVFSLEGVKSTVKSTVVNAKDGGYSVKPQVEALTSLLIHKRTRQVIFFWAEMFFHGELMEVNSNYTMFNKKGNPIKAEVTLVIQQPDGSDEFTSDVTYWNESFDAAFGVGT